MKRIPTLALAALGLAILASCSGGGAAPSAPPPLPEVTVVTLEPRDVELSFEAPGRLQGSREVEVRSRVEGILLEWLYHEGAPVTEGQLLFRIDPALYAAAADRAAATVAEAEARLARAERDVARLGPLADQEAVSRRESDDAVSERDLAAATLKSAQATLHSAQLELGYTRVTAPVSGVSGRALMSEGSLVDDRSLLTTISRIDPIWALFALSDRDLLRLQAELVRSGRSMAAVEAELVLADGSSFPLRGRINFMGSQIDPTSGSVELRAAVDNSDALLLPGQFVRVVLHGIERRDAILVPQRAVQQSSTGRSVLVLGADGRAEARPVELESWNGDQWLVAAGLAAGERVIVDGALKVRPGSEVRVSGEEATGDDPDDGGSAGSGARGTGGDDAS